MKQLRIGQDTLVTGSAVADALLEYAQIVIRNGTSATVTIPILATNGMVDQRSILIGPATQLETQDVDGVTDDELNRFPVPKFTPIGGKGAPADLEPLPGMPEGLDPAHRRD